MESVLGSLNRIFFVIVVVMTSAAVIKNFTVKKDSDVIRFKWAKDERVYYVVLAVIAMIGVAVRVWKFGDIPGGFNQDGAMAAVDGKALAEYGTDRFGTWLPVHLNAWGYGQMSSLLSYMIAIFVKLFGLSVVTARLPQLLASIAGGIFFYLFMRDIFGRKTGMIAAAFVVINPWHLVQSRWALDCNLLPHFFMGGLYFFNWGLSKRRKMIYVSMALFGLCMYCYGITIYTIPVFLLAACIYFLLKKKITIKEIFLCSVVYLAVAWPFLLTMAVNFFKWNTIELPFATIQYFEGSVRASDILLFSEEPLQQLFVNFKHLLNTTILQKKDLPWNDVENFGTMFLCSMPFMLAGGIGYVRKKAAGEKTLVMFALFAGVWAGLLTNNVNVNRVNLIYYGIMMLIVLGIDFVTDEIRFTRCVNLAIYVMLGVMLIETYFGTYAEMIRGQFYYGFGESLIAAKESGAEKIYVTADAQAKGYGNVSEILTLFYDKTDAEYFQGKKDKSNGQKLLPYKERFIYASMSEGIIEESVNEDASYVILNADRELFDEKQYEILQCGNFCAVIKK